MPVLRLSFEEKAAKQVLYMLSVDKAILVVVDVQGKLAQLMHEKEALFRNLSRAIRGAQALGLPMLWCEQNPAGLGPTIPEIADLLRNQQPISKMTFSCFGNPQFRQMLELSGRKQILLAGIEAHVCIYLSAADLVNAGYEVEVIADAVSSRLAQNKQIALEKIRALPAGVTCIETVLFECLGKADAPKFKEVLSILK